MADDNELHSIGDGTGPYDIDELASSAEDLANSHLDLGSVLIPVVEGGHVTVQMSADHQPEAVHLVSQHGRINVLAFAAPKSGGLWREVVRELAESLRAEGAKVSITDEHWGREVVAEVPGGQHRFIGVDGPRWMVRCTATGPAESAGQLAQLARAVLAETVVRRGKGAAPPRELLPVVLPPVLVEQVAAAQQQMAEQQKAQQAGQQPAGQQPAQGRVPGGALDQAADARVERPAPPPTEQPAAEPDPEPAPKSQGSAMQRLRRKKS